MRDPKYPEYNGVLRFDDDNIVEVGLEPDTENIMVTLNGREISGGSTGGSDVMVVKITIDDLGSMTADKTYVEITSAFESNTPVIVVLMGNIHILSEYVELDESLIFRTIPKVYKSNNDDIVIQADGISITPADEIAISGSYMYTIQAQANPPIS